VAHKRDAHRDDLCLRTLTPVVASALALRRSLVVCPFRTDSFGSSHAQLRAGGKIEECRGHLPSIIGCRNNALKNPRFACLLVRKSPFEGVSGGVVVSSAPAPFDGALKIVWLWPFFGKPPGPPPLFFCRSWLRRRLVHLLASVSPTARSTNSGRFRAASPPDAGSTNRGGRFPTFRRLHEWRKRRRLRNNHRRPGPAALHEQEITRRTATVYQV